MLGTVRTFMNARVNGIIYAALCALFCCHLPFSKKTELLFSMNKNGIKCSLKRYCDAQEAALWRAVTQYFSSFQLFFIDFMQMMGMMVMLCAPARAFYGKNRKSRPLTTASSGAISHEIRQILNFNFII